MNSDEPSSMDMSSLPRQSSAPVEPPAPNSPSMPRAASFPFSDAVRSTDDWDKTPATPSNSSTTSNSNGNKQSNGDNFANNNNSNNSNSNSNSSNNNNNSQNKNQPRIDNSKPGMKRRLSERVFPIQLATHVDRAASTFGSIIDGINPRGSAGSLAPPSGRGTLSSTETSAPATVPEEDNMSTSNAFPMSSPQSMSGCSETEPGVSRNEGDAHVESSITLRPSHHRNNLNLGIIGNCSYSFLIDQKAKVVFGCLPRFDSDPIFCDLLSGGNKEFGFFDILMDEFESSEQAYVPNTAVLRTVLIDKTGHQLEVIDYAPRFRLYDRFFHPMQFIRIIRPLKGHPRITVRCRPGCDYGSKQADSVRGSNHVRYGATDVTVRLTTDCPVSFITEEVPFVVQKDITLILGPDETLQNAPKRVGIEFLEKTTEYWTDVARSLHIPFEWQDAVIRAAITLKLCSFEESGAIIAAMTTSIPEAPNSGRNWDYRFCWLRDSFHTVRALNRMGATQTMQHYLDYIVNIIVAARGNVLQPLYGLMLESELKERIVDLPGYRSMGPVRVGNLAYVQTQNDSYGSVILAVTQMFFDHRLPPGSASVELFEQMEKIGEIAIKVHNDADAGLWELRNSQQVHTMSTLMCWAGCDRLARISKRLGFIDRESYWQHHADQIKDLIMTHAWDEKQQTFVATLRDPAAENADSVPRDVDASTLLMCDLGFIDPKDPRYISTVDSIGRVLRRNNFLFRYASRDDFGTPEVAFNICTFWYIDALAAIGRKQEARELFENMLSHRNHVGILSEDIDPVTGELWGNYPQTYSMCGIINSAMILSESWPQHGL